MSAPYLLLPNNAVMDVNEESDNISTVEIDATPGVSAITAIQYLDVWGANGGDGTNGTGPKEFNAPFDICVNSTGALYISDYGNGRIQVIDTDGTFIKNIPFMGAPTGIVCDSDDSLWVTDFWNDTVTNMDSDGIISTSFGSTGFSDGEFFGAFGIYVNATNIFVVDGYNNRIQMFDKSGTFLDKWGANGGDGTNGTLPGEFIYPSAIDADSDGNFYIIDDNRVQKFDNTMNYIDEITLMGEINESYGINYDSTHDILFIGNAIYDTSLNWVMNFTAYGSAVDELMYPTGYVISDDILYVTDGGLNKTILFEINPVAGEITPPEISTFPNLVNAGIMGDMDVPGMGIGQYYFPGGICINGSGYVFIADSLNNRIEVLDPMLIHQYYIDLFMPVGLECDISTDILYISQGFGCNVTMMNTDGSAVTSVGVFGTGDGEFNVPHDIYVNDTHVLVPDTWNNRTQWLDKNLVFLEKYGANGGDGTPGNPPDGLTVPRGIALDSDGYIYITEDMENRVQKFDPSMNYVRSFTYDGSKGYGIYYDSEYNALFLGDGIYNLTGSKIAEYGVLDENLYIYDIERSDNLIYMSSGDNHTIQILKIINDTAPSTLTYRSVFTSINVTSEFWRFDNISRWDDIFYYTRTANDILKYNLTTSTWEDHPMLIEQEVISQISEYFGEDEGIGVMDWGSIDTLWLPNLIWDINQTGLEIGNCLNAWIDSMVYDIVDSGTNWIKYTSSDINYQGYFIYIRVDSDGILQEFQHMEDGIDIVHLIIEDDVVGFLVGLQADFGTPDPVYTTSYSDPNDQYPSSTGGGDTDGSNMDFGTEIEPTLFRYTPVEERVTVVSYENNDAFENTQAISTPVIEVQTTELVAECEYFDEDTGTWMPVDNGEGGNTFIIGTATSESILPVVDGDDLRVPLVIPPDVNTPSEEDVESLFGEDVVVAITDHGLYFEYTHDGNTYYVDVEYNEDGTVSSVSSRLPTEGGVVESQSTVITEEAANAYVDTVLTELEEEDEEDPLDDDDGMDELLYYLIPLYVITGISLVIGIVNKSKISKIKIDNAQEVAKNLGSNDE